MGSLAAAAATHRTAALGRTLGAALRQIDLSCHKSVMDGPGAMQNLNKSHPRPPRDRQHLAT